MLGMGLSAYDVSDQLEPVRSARTRSKVVLSPSILLSQSIDGSIVGTATGVCVGGDVVMALGLQVG